MSITSLRRTLSLRVSPLLMSSCQEINPEFCTDHPDDTVCLARGHGGDGGVGNGVDGGRISVSSCTSNAQCALPTPICDTTRSMCVPCTTVESSACRGTTPTCGDADTCRGCQLDSECESSTGLPECACQATITHSLIRTNVGRDMGADEIQ
jgi:hypothetical protein